MSRLLSSDIQSMRYFYTDHLKHVLLPFWLRSVDWEDGGYLNGYDNSGLQLLHTDKFTWSQGRFVWIYSKLATMQGETFEAEEKQYFLRLAEHGARFLREHCLLENGHCVFLLDKQGNPKLPAGSIQYDSSIFADCFAAGGMAKYASASGDFEALDFAHKLYDSIVIRVDSGYYATDPYPIPAGYRIHSIPMILLNLTQELLEAEEELHGNRVEPLQRQLMRFMDDIALHFIDGQGILNEMLGLGNQRVDSLLGRYCNPGHAIEDMWFLMHAARKLNCEAYIELAAHTTKVMVALGWDPEHGGLLLFVDRDGGPPRGSKEGFEDTPMALQIENNWDSKLWWPHSEALYTTLLGFHLTGDPELWEQFNMVQEYTFRTFPNPDATVGEWIQIRARDGAPVSKVVALPVKDPYHIIRNVVYIIELLAFMEQKS